MIEEDCSMRLLTTPEEIRNVANSVLGIKRNIGWKLTCDSLIVEIAIGAKLVKENDLIKIEGTRHYASCFVLKCDIAEYVYYMLTGSRQPPGIIPND